MASTKTRSRVRSEQSNGEVDVVDWAATLPDSFIMCRDLGHTWRPFRAWWDNEMNVYKRVLRCGRCKTERQQDLTASGEIATGHYIYAEGYQVPKGTGRLDHTGRSGLRLESTLRLIGKDEQ